jgi:hypothetical protein
MSTKTSFKRIALVAVAAMGFGMLSVVPSSAADAAFTNSVDYAASTIEVGQDAVLVLHQDFLGETSTNAVVLTFAVTGNANSADTSTASNTVMPNVFAGTTIGTVSTGSTTNDELARGYTAGAVYGGFPAADVNGGKANINATTSVASSGTTIATVTNTMVSSTTLGTARARSFQRVEWKPTIVGTYQLTIKSTVNGVVVNAYVWNFTVNAAGTAATAAAKAALALQTPSATWSKSINGYNYCGSSAQLSMCAVAATYDRVGAAAPISATAADEAVHFNKNLGVGSVSIPAAAIVGNVNSATSTGNTLDPMKGATIYAEVSGPGILTLSDYTNSANNSNGRSVKITLGQTSYAYQVLVGTDGTAGKATITISAANTISATPVVIATETVVFFDTPSKASLTQLAYSINGDAAAAATAVATLAVTDKDGNAIPYAHFTNLGYYASAASANTTVLPAQTALTSKTLSLQPKGALYGTSDVIVTVQNDAGATAAKIAAGTSAPTGFSDAAKLIPTVKFATAAQSVIVAKNKIATLTVTPSNAGQFAPGSVQTLTFVAKDVNGLAVPDSLTASVTSVSSVATSIATQNGLAVADFASLSSLGPWGLGTVLGLDAAGTMTRTLYAPIAEGDFTLSMLLGSTNYETALAATLVSLKLTVTPGAATIAATEALNAAAEALDAANAATDAANAATDAADAATAAAQDAADAVAALAVTTQAQIASMRLQNIALSKKIIALTNLVNKLLKK